LRRWWDRKARGRGGLQLMRKCGVEKKEKRNALRNKMRKKMMKRNGNKKSKKYIFFL
jgi:hypothetical protein